MKFNILLCLQCILFHQTSLASQAHSPGKGEGLGKDEGFPQGDVFVEEEGLQCEHVNPSEVYANIVQIGRGGFGKVYKAEKLILQFNGSQVKQTVALKELSLSKGNELDTYEEYRLHARLKHENLAQVFGCYKSVKVNDQDELVDTLWIEMELIDGVNLHELVERAEAIHIDSALRILGSMLSALSYLHDEKVTHRDIKPENFMVSKSGELKLIDFGLAMGALSNPKQNLTGGTDGYMAPEAYCPPHSGYNEGCDIWGAGATFYFMCEGVPPLSHLNWEGLVEYMRRCRANPEKFERWTLVGKKLNLSNSSVSLNDLQRVLDSMSQINPDNRPHAKDMVLKGLTWNELNGQERLKKLVEIVHLEISLESQSLEAIDDGVCIYGNPLDVYGDLEEIGSGGYGTVYRARRLYQQGDGSQEFVALKKMNALYERREKRALSEFSIQKRFSHENIVKVYDCYLTEETNEGRRYKVVWISMEYIDGITLHDLIRSRTPMPVNVMLYIFKSILAAVGYLHSNDVIHRDIKGDNVLISTDGKIKLIDFGLATEFTQAKRPKSRFGTSDFKAPEVFFPSEEGYDNKCDIWSLGSLFYMMCEGDYLFGELENGQVKRELLSRMNDVGQSLDRRLQGANLKLEGNFEILNAFQKILLKMLRWDPNSRPTASELYSASVIRCDILEAQNFLRELIEAAQFGSSSSQD